MRNIETHSIVTAGMITALTAVGAFIRIPFVPVPITLQSFFTLLAGNLLSPKRAALSQTVYLMIGLAGVPVFVQGGGPAYILQPTFGYLLALPLAAFVIAVLRQRFARNIAPLSIFGINITAALLIQVVGVIWLFLSMNYIVGQPLTTKAVLISGMVVFFPGDLVKCLIATVIVVRLSKRTVEW
jgi:biotin transport system substrate-specific component